jgi:serine/threonine protein kinase
MLMDLLGKSLEDIFVAQNKKMSVKSVLILGEQIMDRIEAVHEKKIIHRDIKPDNFLMGDDKNASTVYIVDFGLSKRYIKDSNLEPISRPTHPV